MSAPQLPSKFQSRSPWSDPVTISRQAPHVAVWDALRKGSILAWSFVGFIVVAVIICRLFPLTLAQTIRVERSLRSQPPPDFMPQVKDGNTMELRIGITANGTITLNHEPVTDLSAALKKALDGKRDHPIVATISAHPDADSELGNARVIEILNALAVERVPSVTFAVE